MDRSVIKKVLEERFAGRELVGSDEDSLRARLLDEADAVIREVTRERCEVSRGDIDSDGAWMVIYCEDGDEILAELEGETEVKVKVKRVRVE